MCLEGEAATSPSCVCSPGFAWGAVGGRAQTFWAARAVVRGIVRFQGYLELEVSNATEPRRGRGKQSCSRVLQNSHICWVFHYEDRSQTATDWERKHCHHEKGPADEILW